MSKLFAAAAKRCITPSQEMIQKVNLDGRYHYEGVGEDLDLRVVIFSNNTQFFLIIASDLSTYPVTGELIVELERKYGIPSDHIMCGGSRSHNTISCQGGATYDKLKPGTAEYVRFVHKITVEAVGDALTKLVPARIGAAMGYSRINVSREFPSPIGTIESQNHSAPDAPWLRVVKVEALTGETIAVLANYSMHCCLLCWNDIIGDYRYINGDVAAAVSRYVERAGKNQYPVLWFVGGGTDRQPTIYSRLERCAVKDDGEFYLEREILPIAGTLMLLRQYAAEQGLDILRTLNTITEWSDQFDFFSAIVHREVPAKENMVDQVRRQMPDADPEVRYVPGMDVAPRAAKEPLHFTYRLAVLNGIAFAGVNASPYAAVYQKLMERMPFPVTMLFDDCFGSVSSIPNPEVEENHIYGHSTLQNRCLSARIGTDTFLDAFDALLAQYNERTKS